MIRSIIEATLANKNISKRAFCSDNGINYSNFCAFLRGANTLSVSKLENVLQILGLTISATDSQLEIYDIENYTYGYDVLPTEVETIDKELYRIEDYPLHGDAPKSLIIIGGIKYIAKTGHKWYPIESITEYLLNQLGCIFGLNMAECRLAVLNDQLRFLSKWFLFGTEYLVHGSEIFDNYLNDVQFVREIEKQKMARELFTLQFVEKSVKHFSAKYHYTIMHNLVKLLLYDALVGNNDRHFENWAVIVKTEDRSDPIFSPIYDTARGLFWNQSEQSLESFTDAKIKKYSQNSKPKLGWDGVKDKDLNHFRLVEEIYKNEFYITKNEIFDLFSPMVIDRMKQCVNNNYTTLMSPRRIEVITKCLDFRYQTIKNILQ